MAQTADIGSKRLIGLSPDAWVQWVTQQADVVSRGLLASEFQWISRDADALIRAYSPTIGEFLVLNEIQLYVDQHMPLRVNAYASLAEEKYKRPVFAVVINILPPSKGSVIVDRYEQTVLGLSAWREYRVINLWEIDAEVAFQPGLRPLVPFVPVLRGGNDEVTIREALRVLRDDEQLHEMETLLAFFASFVLETRLVQQIMRWDMVVLEKSPWYQEILERGRQEGLLEGRQEGLLEGRQEMLQRMLARRFGDVPPEVAERLTMLASHQIDVLIDAALLAGSLDEFLAQIPDATREPPNGPSSN